jgi:peptide/nickel transport system permease protein
VLHRIDFIIRKLAFSMLTLIAVLVFNFALFRIVPGDPVQMLESPRMRPEARERIRHAFGLDKPIWLDLQVAREKGSVLAVFDSQFFYYVMNLVRGEMGESFVQQQPVSEVIYNRLGPTILLVFSGQFLGIIFGTTIGLVAAWKKRSLVDAIAMFVGLTTFSLPPFWLGIIFLTLARGHLPMRGITTAGTIYANNWEKIYDIARHLVLPAGTLAILLFGAYMLVVRNTTLEVLAEDYILTAKAKGLSTIQVLRDHALKNASLPLVTIIAMDLGYALGGTIQIETIFSWPGLGRLMFDSIGQRDYPVLQGVFLMLAVGVIGANFLADLTYVLLDPRVKA